MLSLRSLERVNNPAHGRIIEETRKMSVATFDTLQNPRMSRASGSFVHYKISQNTINVKFAQHEARSRSSLRRSECRNNGQLVSSIESSSDGSIVARFSIRQSGGNATDVSVVRLLSVNWIGRVDTLKRTIYELESLHERIELLYIIIYDSRADSM